jgi:hypothetical protein
MFSGKLGPGLEGSEFMGFVGFIELEDGKSRKSLKFEATKVEK